MTEHRGARGRALTVTEVEWSPQKLTASFDIGDNSNRISLETSEALDPTPDAFLALGLLPAMKLGVPLRIPEPVSPRLLENANRIQQIFRLSHEDARVVEIEARPRRKRNRGDGRVGAFFSGGVDSFYTLLRRREEITDLIFIEGFDIPLHGGGELQRLASEMATNVAQTLDKNLIRVRAEVRHFSDQYVGFAYYFGSALAAVALLFQGRLGEVLVPATQNYGNIWISGSHPLLDPLWSTELTTLVFEGMEATRTEKVEYIASSDLAMRWLRVCLENPTGAYNCGRCEKCIRTLVSLRAVGAEGRCQTLPNRVDPRSVRRLRLTDDRQRAFARDNVRLVEQRRNDRELARALRTSLRRDLWRAALRATFFDPAPERVKSLLRAARAGIERLQASIGSRP